MRVLTGLVAVALAAATTGCIETLDSGDGYSQPYYGGYRQPVNNYYVYQPQPQVITQTRYVAVPTAAPAPRRHQWSERRRERDRDNDGVPDRKERRARRDR